MNLELAAKRQSILDTLSRYADAADAGDYGRVSQAFMPNGQMKAAGRVLTGRQSIHETLRRLYLERNGDAAGNFQRHHVTTALIDFTGESSATGTIYVIVVTERGVDHSARYLDRYAMENGRFLIAERTIHLDWMVEGSRFGSFKRNPT